MKKVLFLTALILCSLGVRAQNVKTEKADSVFIAITMDSPFSKCFGNVDANKDGLVTFAEANAADTLNLKYFSPGNATVEELDLRNMKKLEVLDLTLAPFVKKITIVTGCYPKIIYPSGEGDFTVTRVYDPADQSTWWH